MPVLHEISTITAKGQTTVPKAVRQVLGVGAGDQIEFRVEDGEVTVLPVAVSQEDPVIGRFLDFIARDLEQHPAAVKAISPQFARRVAALVGRKKVDLTAPIEGEVDL